MCAIGCMASAATTIVTTPPTHENHAAPVSDEYPPIHGAMNNKIPSAPCTHSIAIMLGRARFTKPDTISRIPRITISAMDAPIAVIQIVDNATTAPTTTVAQSSHRVHLCIETSLLHATTPAGVLN